jgi:amylosucrase
MGHALIASFGGIPLLYMGDELGLLNDHSYESDPELAADGRWMHRPRMDWDWVKRLDPGSAQGRILAGTKAIMARRKATPAFSAAVPTQILDLGNPALFLFRRADAGHPVTCVFNFTETDQGVTPWGLGLEGGRDYRDLLTGRPLALTDGMVRIGPYQALWLQPA